FSAPVYDDGDWRGVLIATLGADSAFGEVRMEDVARHGSTALLGPRDNDRSTEEHPPLPTDFAFLVHRGLRHGEERALDPRIAARLRAEFGAAAPPGEQFKLCYAPPLMDRRYRDPMRGFEGEWL